MGYNNFKPGKVMGHQGYKPGKKDPFDFIAQLQNKDNTGFMSRNGNSIPQMQPLDYKAWLNEQPHGGQISPYGPQGDDYWWEAYQEYAHMWQMGYEDKFGGEGGEGMPPSPDPNPASRPYGEQITQSQPGETGWSGQGEYEPPGPPSVGTCNCDCYHTPGAVSMGGICYGPPPAGATLGVCC
jgi:hypothetical protein